MRMGSHELCAVRTDQDKSEVRNMNTETSKREMPPYVAYSTFTSFIKSLSETGIPSRIDKSLLRSMSGSNQSAVISALKWFDLIDANGGHGQKLEALVASGDKFGHQLKSLLPSAYEFMADGSINLERATGAQLEERFRGYGISGSTVIKAMAFFISACKDAGIQLSAHIKLPKRVVAPSKPKKGRASEGQEELGESNGDVTKSLAQPSLMSALMDKFPAFDPTWPEKSQEQWFAAFARMQEMIKAK